MSGNGFRLSAPTPSVVQRANEIVSLAGATTARTKAIAIFFFVRDAVKFGFTRKFDNASPEETLKAGVGHCNPQGALFASLLQAQGIPARQCFVNLNNGVLRGVLSPPPARLVHSYVELQLPEEAAEEGSQSSGDREGSAASDGTRGDEKRPWIRVDGYIADPALFHAARARLQKEDREEGFGVHVNGSIEWDGKSDCFCQMANESKQVSEKLGAFDEPQLLYESPRNFQRLPWPIRVGFGLVVWRPNSNIDAIRAEYVAPTNED